jgi:hypothetical protein
MKDSEALNLLNLAKRRWYILAAVGVACYLFVLLVVQAFVLTIGDEFFDGNFSGAHPQPAILCSHDPRLKETGSKLFNLVVLKTVVDHLAQVVLIPAVIVGYGGYSLGFLYGRFSNMICESKMT